MPWGNNPSKEKAIQITKDAYTYETPFTNFENLTDDLIKKFNYKLDKLGINLDSNLDLINYLFRTYLPEWEINLSKYDFTTDPKINLSYPEFDAFVLYSLIRHNKPSNIIEIGSGMSTRVIIKALNKNNNLNGLTCIEPFDRNIDFLKEIYPGINIITDLVENIDMSVFTNLKENDLLFIDSSHVLRPFGDVEYEFLHILPSLSKGVIVHVHDIFYPYNYPELWSREWKAVLTEQQCLVLFLYGNKYWEVLWSNNDLIQNKKINSDIPFLKRGGSFYMRKTD
jgi:predicted O-methyltransferase YrrM